MKKPTELALEVQLAARTIRAASKADETLETPGNSHLKCLRLVKPEVRRVAGSRAETDDVGWQRFWCVDVRPAVLFEQFKRKLKLVVERQALDRVRDRWLVSDNFPHVSESSPGSMRRQHAHSRYAFSSRLISSSRACM